MTTELVLQMKHVLHLAFLTLCWLTSPAFALGLGNAAGQIVIGQPLAIRIPLSGPEAAKIKPDCMWLLADDSDIADPVIKSATLKIGNGAVMIETRQAVSQPLVSFRLMIDCGTPVARNYQLLPLLTVAESKPAASPPPVAVREAIPRAAPARTGDATSFTLTQPSTLRLISRQRHPNNSRARVLFIRRVAATNPNIFPTIESAFDLSLAAGQQLHLPTDLPSQENPLPARKSGPENQGGGRLVIGAGASLNQTVDELGSDLTRLTIAMNDQILIQTSMVEKIMALEAEFATAKQAAALQRAVNQDMGKEIRELRDQQRRNSHIQLFMAILLGGLAGFNLLRWHYGRQDGNLFRS